MRNTKYEPKPTELPERPAWKDLPTDAVGTMDRIVAFLQLAEGEPWDFGTLVVQCTESRKARLVWDAIDEAVQRGLIVSVGEDEWMAVIP